ncbi:CopG family transcriptional regulator [Photobacterium phosphoreum]|uniref:CopG family ribbon-helix-helix protein n=1 Tax=Photobacterium phosphoreum TaxID=659 RepID=UPI000D157074|nr:CopG family ribbon-helix-helix protein [Photobacterium phosphoreum]PSW24742.1 CopG family transcriptional regulator [Photobacterium phosphoreum]
MTTTTSVKLDDELKSRVQNLANIHRRSAHWIMREAINEYVEREEKRAALNQETQKALHDYQETNLHLTAQEVEASLGDWGTTYEQSMPTCHQSFIRNMQSVTLSVYVDF